MIFKIIPVLKDYIWGGNKLKLAYGKASDLENVAESWELSTHPAGQCYIEVGGKPVLLADYLHQKGQGDIPILIKLIDARDNLSVQVHPDDDYARIYENDLGKTEMWYVLEAEEGAHLIYGFNKEVSKEEFRKSIEEQTLSTYLNKVEVHKGDVFFINPGTMHAIGKGIVIAEIQESSNVTYRVYDYGRIGVDGKPRDLHVEKALEITSLHQAGESRLQYEMISQLGGRKGLLAKCPYFKVQCLEVEEEMAIDEDEQSFQHLLVVDGEIQLHTEEGDLVGHKGESFFVESGTKGYRIMGKGQIVLSSLS